MQVRAVLDCLCRLAPPESALSFDNVGLLLGDAEAEVCKAVVCLDCTGAAIDYAVQNNAGLIITHHPVIFDPLRSVTAQSTPLAYRCLSGGISVISMHTNLDSAEGGVNDCLAAALGLREVFSITDAEGFSFRCGSLEAPVCADAFALHIRTALGGTVRYTDGGKPIQRVAVCGGSGSAMIDLAFANGADAMVTAEIKHSIFLQAAKQGRTVFDAGHFHTENTVVEPLCAYLQKQLPEIAFLPRLQGFVKVK